MTKGNSFTRLTLYRKGTLRTFHNLLQSEGYRLVDARHGFVSDRYVYSNAAGNQVAVRHKGLRHADIADGFDKLSLHSSSSMRALGFQDSAETDTLKILGDVEAYLSNLSGEMSDKNPPKKLELRRLMKKVLFAFSGEYQSPQQFRDVVLGIGQVLGHVRDPEAGLFELLDSTVPALIRNRVVERPENLPVALMTLLNKADEYAGMSENNQQYFYLFRVPEAIQMGIIENMDDLDKLHVKALIRTLG